MKKIRKSVMMMAACASLLLCITGCSKEVEVSTTKPEGTAGTSAESKVAESKKGSDETVNISMTWWGDTNRNEVYNKVIDAFEAENPDVKVERPYQTWANYFDILSTQMAGGNAPDVIGMHQRYVAEYTVRGALLDLQPYVDSGALDVSDIPESVLDSGYVNKKLFMITQGMTSTATSYNTSVLDQLGVAYPDMDWTFDEFKAKLEEIKAAADSKGMELWPSGDFSQDLSIFTFWARVNGQHLFTEDGKVGFTEDVVTSWFKFWKDLRDQNLIPDAATVVEYASLPLEQSLFATNKVAIATMPASQIGQYQAQVTDDGQIEIVRFPHLEGKTDPEFISGAFFTVNSASKNPEAAARLIDFFINNPEAQKIFKLEQGVPAATAAAAVVAPELSASEQKTMDYIQNQLVKHATSEPYPPTGFNEISSNYVTISSAVAYGQMTPEEGAAEFMKVCNGILTNVSK